MVASCDHIEDLPGGELIVFVLRQRSRLSGTSTLEEWSYCPWMYGGGGSTYSSRWAAAERRETRLGIRLMSPESMLSMLGGWCCVEWRKRVVCLDLEG
jgi:hypothetical protein